MKNKIIKFIILMLFCIVLLLIIFPFIEINYNGKIIKFSYSGDVSKYEENACYDESYFYNKEKNISTFNFDFKNFWFFHIITMEYSEGNICDNEYVLDEEYIHKIIESAEIIDNSNNIDLDKLLEGKTAIVGNTRYHSEDYTISMDYKLDGKEETLFIFYVGDLLVIQIGLSDEGPKYIAYK